MGATEECWFDHEKLEVYREAIAFIAWLSANLDGMARVGDAKDQLDRASTSIPLNIAEGDGKYALKDRQKKLAPLYPQLSAVGRTTARAIPRGHQPQPRKHS
jgi:hypothetical protein